jgi:hypothetical protein
VDLAGVVIEQMIAFFLKAEVVYNLFQFSSPTEKYGHKIELVSIDCSCCFARTET